MGGHRDMGKVGEWRKTDKHMKNDSGTKRADNLFIFPPTSDTPTPTNTAAAAMHATCRRGVAWSAASAAASKKQSVLLGMRQGRPLCSEEMRLALALARRRPTPHSFASTPLALARRASASLRRCAPSPALSAR